MRNLQAWAEGTFGLKQKQMNEVKAGDGGSVPDPGTVPPSGQEPPPTT